MRVIGTVLVSLVIAGGALGAGEAASLIQGGDNMTVSLDGEWLLATDPGNVGREGGWCEGPVSGARATKVPWIIQDAFPGYHGIAWYWREFAAPVNPHPGGRTLLRFWAVDYLADVWVNGAHVGGHEGGETPFVLDVTDVVRTDGPNLLAVRVHNPTNDPIDGIVLRETPARNKVIPYSAGSSYNHGGIVDSVELIVAPAVRIADVFARTNVETGELRVQVEVHNAAGVPVAGRLVCSVGPAASGTTLQVTAQDQTFGAGETVVEAMLVVAQRHLWDLNDPYLYRVSARVECAQPASDDECTVRCGFRELRFEKGAFRLNGRRIYLKCSHTGNHCPVGQQFPPDPDMLRRDLLNVKVMGFNAIRFIAGVATRAQLDLCDEIGLMVYEEPYAAWCLADSPKMKERYDRSLLEMVRRDRNHPSITLWGLLNETGDGPVFRNAVAALPKVRELDETRMVLLNSGRWDAQIGSTLTGLVLWRTSGGPDPNVNRNDTEGVLSGLNIRWQPGQLAFHPGPNGEYSVVRFRAPLEGEYKVRADFAGIAQKATTDVHVLQDGVSLFDDGINLGKGPNRAGYEGTVQLRAGATVDCVVGWGNGSHGGDTTALSFVVQGPGGTYDATADLHTDTEFPGVWVCGYLAPGARPEASSFVAYDVLETIGKGNGIGTLSNPGSNEWEDVLDDQHPYQRVPHTASVIEFLRTTGGEARPLFISEYGVGSAVDLCRTVRHYERIGKAGAEDAVFYRDKLDKFLVDFERWHMGDCFGAPEDFFTQSQRSMSAERLAGLNAIRSNPHVVAHSLTGTVDQGMSGEGLFTTFRELKPGTVDAMFEAWAPLRLCLFAAPVTTYRGKPVRVEAVLASEEPLPPGEYPVRVQVVGPDTSRPLDRVVKVTIPAGGPELPMAFPIFAVDVVIDGPEGEYRFLAAIQEGAAAAGGEARFHVLDAAAMPPVKGEVELWGDDAELGDWLTAHGIRTREMGGTASGAGTVLVGAMAPDDDAQWAELMARVRSGATAVFLCPEVFRRGDDAVARLPLERRGHLAALMGWLYHKDEWCKRHPVFEGLPMGGLMDHAFYAEIIPDLAFCDLEAPEEAIAGACNASFDYSSGLLLATYRVGQGRIVLNTLLVRQRLGDDPVAERLLRNLLRYAASG